MARSSRIPGASFPIPGNGPGRIVSPRFRRETPLKTRKPRSREKHLEVCHIRMASAYSLVAPRMSAENTPNPPESPRHAPRRPHHRASHFLLHRRLPCHVPDSRSSRGVPNPMRRSSGGKTFRLPRKARERGPSVPGQMSDTTRSTDRVVSLSVDRRFSRILSARMPFRRWLGKLLPRPSRSGRDLDSKPCSDSA